MATPQEKLINLQDELIEAQNSQINQLKEQINDLNEINKLKDKLIASYEQEVKLLRETVDAYAAKTLKEFKGTTH